jgi:hypothetical protein
MVQITPEPKGQFSVAQEIFTDHLEHLQASRLIKVLFNLWDWPVRDLITHRMEVAWMTLAKYQEEEEEVLHLQMEIMEYSVPLI